MHLVIDLKDESKLSLVLDALQRLVTAEGVDLAVERLERNVMLEAPPESFDWSKWDDIMSRDKLRPGQPEMLPEEEEEWIAEQVSEMRAEERAKRSV